MEYFLLFLEGIVTFISPCILPLLPLYISYFAGDSEGIKTKNKSNVVINSIGFVIGFTIIFTLLGLFAGTIGSFVKRQHVFLNIISGLIVVIFGLNYMGIIKVGFMEKNFRFNIKMKSFKFISSILFGMIFAVGWTPCVGTFLGTALMLAINSNNIINGGVMLLIYSLGLGIPFIICAFLIDRLKETLNSIKRNYRIINFTSGIILVIVGITIMIGYLNRIILFFSF